MPSRCWDSVWSRRSWHSSIRPPPLSKKGSPVSRDAQFYQAYGRMLAESGTRLDSAVTLFEKALEIDNALPEAHYHLGKLLLAKGKAQESLPHLEAAAKLDPKSSRSHLSLANAYRSLGRQDDAARELKLVRELQEK